MTAVSATEVEKLAKQRITIIVITQLSREPIIIDKTNNEQVVSTGTFLSMFI